jgi:hypothetical protein
MGVSLTTLTCHPRKKGFPNVGKPLFSPFLRVADYFLRLPILLPLVIMVSASCSVRPFSQDEERVFLDGSFFGSEMGSPLSSK